MKLCFVTPRFPHPTTKGDKLRVYEALKHLSARHDITLVAATDEAVSPADYAAVARYCRRVATVPIHRWQSLTALALRAPVSPLPLQTLFYSSAALQRSIRAVLASERFDVIHASLIRVLPYLWEVDDTPVVVDLVDALARSIALQRRNAPPGIRFLYALEEERVRRYEHAACARFPRLIVCAEADRLALGAPSVSVIRTCVDLDDFPYRREGRDDDVVVMSGNMGYQPNVEAAVWFAKTVWPRVRSARPGARFRVVGTRPARAVTALGGSDGIEVTGAVADVGAELRRATLSVCPLRGGSGMQIKVLESMASGTPIVATSFGNEGIGARDGQEITIADEPSAFAAAALGLLADPERRDRVAAAGRRFSETEFSWDSHAARLEALYAEAIAGHNSGQRGGPSGS